MFLYVSKFLPHFAGLKLQLEKLQFLYAVVELIELGRPFVSGLMEREQCYPRPVGTSSGYEDQCESAQNNRGLSKLPILEGIW